MNLVYFIVALIILSSELVVADTVKIDFTADDSYSIEVVRIEVGDTIEWLPKNEGHNVEFLAGPKMGSLPEKSDLNVWSCSYF